VSRNSKKRGCRGESWVEGITCIKAIRLSARKTLDKKGKKRKTEKKEKKRADRSRPQEDPLLNEGRENLTPRAREKRTKRGGRDREDPILGEKSTLPGRNAPTPSQ